MISTLTTVTHWLAAAWLAATRGPRMAWLHLELWELQAWMRDCQRDGLHRSLHLDRCAARADELRVSIALLQPPPRGRGSVAPVAGRRTPTRAHHESGTAARRPAPAPSHSTPTQERTA